MMISDAHEMLDQNHLIISKIITILLTKDLYEVMMVINLKMI
jgi:hypothetical protein